MLDKLLEWDQELFLYLNGKHISWLDPVMLFLSSYANWIIVCIIMLVLIFLNAGARKWIASVFFLGSIGMSGLLTNIIKIIIARPRPIHNEAWNDVIHAIESYENTYSFFSSHSATTFTMSVFFFLFFRLKRWYGILAVMWAAVVAYSRIYLAKHYPIDVFVGALFGTLIAIFGYMLYKYYVKKREGELQP